MSFTSLPSVLTLNQLLTCLGKLSELREFCYTRTSSTARIWDKEEEDDLGNLGELGHIHPPREWPKLPQVTSLRLRLPQEICHQDVHRFGTIFPNLEQARITLSTTTTTANVASSPDNNGEQCQEQYCQLAHTDRAQCLLLACEQFVESSCPGGSSLKKVICEITVNNRNGISAEQEMILVVWKLGSGYSCARL